MNGEGNSPPVKPGGTGVSPVLSGVAPESVGADAPRSTCVPTKRLPPPVFSETLPPITTTEVFAVAMPAL